MPENKKFRIILIASIIFIVLLALILGLVLGLKKDKDDEMPADDVEIVNSYDNTEELMKKFPLQNNITVQDGLEKRIQNRLLTGFENWNRGYKAWKKWGNILYTNASIYNVNGARLTLGQYQQAMDVTLKQVNIQLGDFYNMVICGEYTGIFYDSTHIRGGVESKVPVMEFVRFKEYGEGLGTRVVVGWGGTKGDSYNNLIKFQGDHEKMVQDEINNLLMNYQVPTTGTLREKYPILYPVEYLETEKANKFIDIIMEGFDKWNTGIDEYINWLTKGYTSDAKSYGLNGEERNMKTYGDAMKALVSEKKIIKLYFDNILIRDNWAAIHYRYRSIMIESGEKDVGDRMQFLKFKEEENNSYKIEATWIK
jgi:hypothetical protein